MKVLDIELYLSDVELGAVNLLANQWGISREVMLRTMLYQALRRELVRV